MSSALLKQAKFRRNGCPLCLVLSSAKFIFLAKKGNSTWSISAPSTSSSSWGWAHQQVSSAVVTSVSTVDAGQGTVSPLFITYVLPRWPLLLWNTHLLSCLHSADFYYFPGILSTYIVLIVIIFQTDKSQQQKKRLLCTFISLSWIKMEQLINIDKTRQLLVTICGGSPENWAAWTLIHEN